MNPAFSGVQSLWGFNSYRLPRSHLSTRCLQRNEDIKQVDLPQRLTLDQPHVPPGLHFCPTLTHHALVSSHDINGWNRGANELSA